MKLRRQLEEAQRAWARRRGVSRQFTAGGAELLAAASLDDNLYLPLDAEARSEFTHGPGGELNPPDGREGHMYSLASSSALVWNFFGPWKSMHRGPLAHSLGLKGDLAGRMQFEALLPSVLNSHERAHVDLLFPDAHAAVEAKFCEAYDEHPRSGLHPVYATLRPLWSGWPRLYGLAQRITEQTDSLHRFIPAAQLLKHLLGLRSAFGEKFQLAYIWFDVDGRSGREHRRELDNFSALCRADGVSFRSHSYQETFRLLPAGPPAWRSYLTARYALDSLVTEEE
jgi:hypothetical protein